MRLVLALALLLALMPAAAERMYSNDELATALLGKRVINRRGETLGEIADVVVDLERGEARFALVESGGFLGLFGTVRAFPLKWLAPGRRDEVVVLDVGRAELDVAGRAPPTGTRASQILGARVRDASGRETGELRDLVVNLGDGTLRHAVIQLLRPQRQVTVDPRLLAVRGEGVVLDTRHADCAAPTCTPARSSSLR